jgi:signal transduction histidine kinase
MSWVIVVWLFVASACLTLSGMHLLIGWRQRSPFHLWFALMALSAAATGACEMAVMWSRTGAEIGTAIRWAHVPIFALFVSFVFFVQAYFEAGRRWLGWTTIAVRTVCLLVDFLQSPNLTYTEITGVRRIPFLGEAVSVPQGVVSPWARLGQIGSLLLLIFLTDAAITVWRRGDHARASLVGGSAIIFVVAAAGNSALVYSGRYRLPFLVSVPFFVIVLAMSYELTRDVLRASELSQSLHASQRARVESDRRLAVAADAASLGFWVWNVRRDDFWMTPRARVLRGIPADDRIDRLRFLSVVHPDDREGVGRLLDTAASNAGTFELVYRIVRPDAEVRWMETRGAGEIDAEGESWIRGVSIDVTERTLAEREAALRREEVIHLSRVRVLGELSGSLAHELNRPLATILTNAQAAQRLLENPIENALELREILADVVEEDRRAADVIQRLRRLMRRGEIHLETLNLTQIVDEVVGAAKSDLIARGVATSQEVRGNVPSVRGDRIQIEQVLLNLFTNACDAMSQVDVERRRLVVRLDPGSNGSVTVSVADRGPGISPEQLDRVFEPFVTTKETGMGLGLAVCQTIIKAHGGRLWAGNNPDGGATFSFSLPIARPEPG